MAGARGDDAETRPLHDPGPGPDPGSYRRGRSVPGYTAPRTAPGRDTRDRSARGGRRRRAAPPRTPRLFGTRPGRLGVLIVAVCAAAGAVVTVAAGGEPGIMLGGFVVAGTIAASCAVRPGAVYVIIPVPALAYLVAAAIAGMIHDRAADTSRTALLTSATQWFASGFLPMAAATAAAIAITAARRPRARGGRGHRTS